MFTWSLPQALHHQNFESPLPPGYGDEADSTKLVLPHSKHRSAVPVSYSFLDAMILTLKRQAVVYRDHRPPCLDLRAFQRDREVIQ